MAEQVPHYHDWFSTGMMKHGQRRCMTCGMWGEEYDAEKKELTALRAEVAELKAKVAFMEGATPNFCGWPWDAPFQDGLEAAKDEYRAKLHPLEDENTSLKAKLEVASEALFFIDGLYSDEKSAIENSISMYEADHCARQALAAIKEEV